MIQVVLKAVAVLAWLAVVASYGARIHPVGDSLAVFRVGLLVVAALAVIWTDWSRWLRWPLALVALGVLGWHVWMRLPSQSLEPGQFLLYQQNLLYNRTEDAAFLAQISELEPDFITLQEVSKRNEAITDALRATYPTQQLCRAQSQSTEAVLSRFPSVPGTAFCSTPDGLAGVQIQTPSGPVWLISLHVAWPWPYRQPDQVDRLMDELLALEGPVILAGDFNSVAWSWTVKRVARASGTQRVGKHLHTFGDMPVPMHLGIDHVLTTSGLGSVEQMPTLGSDHNGVLARLDGF
ncbi:endonuclease/exonuclease/phosphatase (EEP) superfamily protein YafD [Sagittula marina]|uniref:Endonuclease/exonuclease/phosphatase (EEP) superfamily protein YafD n=1 Tax=Sagittula marina TaxID=943940 RepID=A0A7W6DTH5_9RHOB|nr:endonuclease/exonuclease/phosphatase family protein [Sagittula marina]MBB3986637.1 endonuclease/exonuclease/phosphatase (EEP) superfamily protein YafD [Sagittula marina]